jgi:hypothetical protein
MKLPQKFQRKRQKRRKAPAQHISLPLLSVVIAFILSRLFYSSKGVCFDAGPLTWYWQYIDPVLLKENLLQSLYYLHTQPPLFNLFLGLGLKLFSDYTTFFGLSYISLGLILALSLYLLMNRLGVSDRLSAGLTILFITSPSCILYEKWLFYTYPTTTLLSVSALFLHRFLKKTDFTNGICFFSLLSAIVLIRSLFHIFWFTLFALIIVLCKHKDWKKVAFSCSLPFALLFFLYAKNLYLFGSFSTSTWLGMNLSKMTTFKLPIDEHISLAKEGKLSKFSLIAPFSDMNRYLPYLSESRKSGIPVLDQQRKSTGAVNLNNIGYIEVSRRYLEDAIYVLKNHPEAYISGVKEAYTHFLTPSTDNIFLESNRKHIQGIDRFYNLIFCGQVFTNTKVGLFIAIGLPILFLYLSILILISLKRPVDLAFVLTLLFIWTNIAYVSVVGNMVEVGENNRFRFIIDPLFLVILGLFMESVIMRVKRKIFKKFKKKM